MQRRCILNSGMLTIYEPILIVVVMLNRRLDNDAKAWLLEMQSGKTNIAAMNVWSLIVRMFLLIGWQETYHQKT